MSRKNTNEEIINKIVYLMQRDGSVDAPEDSIKWAKNIFRTRGAAAPEKSAVRKILAVLQMDLSPGKTVFGERSASTMQARQMLFGAGENSVDLRITETEKGLDLHGQILGAGFAGCTVRLGAFETKAGGLSEFKFTAVPTGKYDLILQAGEKEIVIEGLELV